MYVKVTDGVGEAYSIEQLKADNPNTSFPDPMPDNVLASFNVYQCELDEPSYDPLCQRLVPSSFSQDSDGNWMLSHTVENTEEAAAKTQIRRHRNEQLNDTDYLALSDNALSSAMGQYRADLRAVPQQSGFPFSVTWPTKPTE
jgi:hypothetical protein